MSSFKGIDLFGSGPHRCSVGERGSVVVPDAALGTPGPNSYPLGVRELEVVVEGRLVAASSAGLAALRDAVAGQLLNPPTAGALVDQTGRSWADLSFISYEEAGPVDRGRVWSVGYAARFRRFNVLP